MRAAVMSLLFLTTGIAGLTLSGGHGYLSRKYGLTIDNLLEADVVLADGSFVTASKEKNADLLWALRGGGGNFGVVTSFLFQLHPAKIVFAGPIAWDQKHARTIMQRYREFLPKAPEELGAFVGLKKIPSSAPFPREIWGKRICLLMSCYNGSEPDGKKALGIRSRSEDEGCCDAVDQGLLGRGAPLRSRRRRNDHRPGRVAAIPCRIALAHPVNGAVDRV